MLDLNLNANAEAWDEASGNEGSEIVIEKFSDCHVIQMDESGTSNSSVVYADACDDDSCSTRAAADVCTISFDILKHEGVVSKEFFPVTEGGGVGGDFVNFQVKSEESLPRKSCYGVLPDNHSFAGPEVRVMQQKPQPRKKSRRGPRSRSSQYRGVTFYRRTGRWESHIWDCGKQVYLGGFDTAHAAARAYDRAAVKFRGVDADINFNLNDYEDDLKQMKNLTKEEFVQILRRQSTGFSRGSSRYRGVTLHKCGRWEARMGQFLGKKAYDKAAIKCNGRTAITNFESSTYEGEMLYAASNDGIGYNLDLNLGICPPSSRNSQNEGAEQLKFQHRRFDALHGKNVKMDNSATVIFANSPYKNPGMASKHHPSWNSVYPVFFSNYKEVSTSKVFEVGSSQGLGNLSWQMHGSANSIPMQLVTTAASSGFSFSATPPAATIHSKSHIPTTLNFCVTSPVTGSVNSSTFYHQTKPPPQ